jgi:hypothetical protein
MVNLRNITNFEVSKVKPATQKIEDMSYLDAVNYLISGETVTENKEEKSKSTRSQLWDFRPKLVTPYHAKAVESCSSYHGRLIGCNYHPFVDAIHYAFYDHSPLVISPDMIWLLIVQGFANHVNANSEELRSQFVSHEGKQDIIIQRDDFIKGSPENPWPEVFSELSEGVRSHIGAKTHDLLLPSFSTTGPKEQAAAEVALLDAMQSYFKYSMVTMCGIPQIYLEGTTDDWKRLEERTHLLGQFGLEWWVEALSPILKQFINASEGVVTRKFWQSIYKFQSMSGGDTVTGWITTFFPYIKKTRAMKADRLNNPAYFKYSSHQNFPKYLRKKALKQIVERYPIDPLKIKGWEPDGFGTDYFPSGLSIAPFQWNYRATSYKMQFLAGFVGIKQDEESLALRPEIGWAVREVE